MSKDHKILLYQDCKQCYKKLCSRLELLQWKVTDGITNKGFSEILKLIKKFLLEENKLLASTYEAKEVVWPIGLEVQKLHTYPNSCIMYHGEKNKKMEVCPVCKASRYKIRCDDLGDVEDKPPRKRIPTKVMWCFPIISCLKRLFCNEEHNKMLWGHKEEYKVDAMLRHLVNGS
jgi:hypothetical protein